MGVIQIILKFIAAMLTVKYNLSNIWIPEGYSKFGEIFAHVSNCYQMMCDFDNLAKDRANSLKVSELFAELLSDDVFWGLIRHLHVCIAFLQEL